MNIVAYSKQSDTHKLQTHINVLQSQVATLSLTVAALQAQIREIEQAMNVKSAAVPISIPEPVDIQSTQSDLHVDDDSSEGYDTDESPIQTHRVKTRIPRIKTARQKFVYVSNYVDVPDQELSD